MKRTLINILLLAGIFLLAGCQKEGRYGNEGELVVFGASAHSGLFTRSAYGDYNDAGTHQDIKWTDTDEIRIYSPTAARRVAVEQGVTDSDELYYWADYSVIPDTDNPTEATIQNLSNDGTGDYYDQDYVDNLDTPYHVGNGLAWKNGEEDKEHTFYAVYPRLRQGIEDGKGTSPAGVSGQFPLYIPDTQAFSVAGNLELYGYMTAMGKGKATDAEVSLDFYPDFTAFEISIRSAGDAIGLSEFRLVSDDDSALCGDYTVEVKDANGTHDYTCSSATGKEIVVNLTGKEAPAKDTDTDLVFTVLALPQDFAKLHVEFKKATGETRKLALKYADDYTENPGGYIEFAKCLKHRIYGLALPNGELLISVGTAPWAAGGEFDFVTIENITTSFVEARRFDSDGDYTTWDIPGTYIQIAKGIAGEEPVDPENPSQGTVVTNRPEHSPMFTLETVSVGVVLQLCSDNSNFKFVTTTDVEGVFTEPAATLDIRASEDLTDVVTTKYFVVAEDAEIGESANIRLIRTDANVPVAYSHSDLPGSPDHTKVPFWLSSVNDYTANTHILLPQQ
ncbi:MAG: hypothetical protein K5910_09170 [Bacteroidales bacterium]|nr:hypothetical protein [Bacteroidales bacterium]